ncbi:MAG: peptidoglycan-associated lipoprotein Pal [Bacteriovoracales bacterium]|jgi:peptidoglycan-associated lipoprotein
MKKIAGIIFLSSFLAFVGCSSKKKDTGMEGEQPMTTTTEEGSQLNISGDSDNKTAGGLTTVFFDFDSSTLRSDTKSALDANNAFLTSNSTVEVQIEGHCDERGGVEYNLALGERRAKAVMDYLTAMGIPAARITTISYGKEKPIAMGHDESSWSQNRRANFVITKK